MTLPDPDGAGAQTSPVTTFVFDDAGRMTSYNPFGEITSETNATVDHIFGYTGRESDAESDLYYYRARYYDPEVGRFVSEDPIGFAAGDVNVNRYVGNAATNATDPSGLDERKVGDYLVNDGRGHHIIPVEIWDDFGFSEEVYSVFDSARIGTDGGHNYLKHGTKTGYSGHVKAELREKLAEFLAEHSPETKCLTIEQQKDCGKTVRQTYRNHRSRIHKWFQ